VLQTAMNIQSSYLHNVVGKVIELHLPYKAVVAFQYKGKQERALLKADKIIVDGFYVPMVCFLSDPCCKLFLTLLYSGNKPICFHHGRFFSRAVYHSDKTVTMFEDAYRLYSIQTELVTDCI
jgi:hypothetical protein